MINSKVMWSIILFVFFSFISHEANFAASYPTYSISSASKPYANAMTNFSTYNEFTRNYYTIRSYMNLFEKNGGGTLILEKGTYNIPSTIYIPSNVTLKLRDGVNLVKSQKTGTSKLKASKSMFQLIRQSYHSKKGIYGKYDGEHDISIIGEKEAYIDLKYAYKTYGIVAGHNQNITISGITFKNLNSGHFIEMDATKNIKITNNKFIDSKPSPSKNAEAINLDTPDRITKGWNNDWSNYDKTPNYEVSIQDNYFYNLDKAIGTHQYSQGKYHTNIVIKNNVIDTMRSDAIRFMNWKDSVITNNKISNVGEGTFGKDRGILVSGAINPDISSNEFSNVFRAIQITPCKNIGTGSSYDISYNKLSEKNNDQLRWNIIDNVGEDFVKINHIYDEYREDIEIIYILNKFK